MKGISEIKAQLEQGVENIKSGEGYRQWLSTVSKFHSYSLNNLILIAMQKPEAQRVAGYQTWKKLGRQVKTGEKAIRIIAPCPYKRKATDTNGDEVEIDAMTFRAVAVFDISQTEGEDLPTLAKTLTGDVEAYRETLGKLNPWHTSSVTIWELTRQIIHSGILPGGERTKNSKPVWTQSLRRRGLLSTSWTERR